MKYFSNLYWEVASGKKRSLGYILSGRYKNILIFIGKLRPKRWDPTTLPHREAVSGKKRFLSYVRLCRDRSHLILTEKLRPENMRFWNHVKLDWFWTELEFTCKLYGPTLLFKDAHRLKIFFSISMNFYLIKLPW